MPELNLGGHVYALLPARNYFVNPATTTAYKWNVNHKPDGDKGTSKKRQIETTANTGNVGLVRQQSADEPLVLKREGQLLDEEQEQMMWAMFALCKTQTIYFVEFSGDAYEVQIIDFEVKKIGSGGPTRRGEGFYAEYSIEMECYAILTGVLAAAGVTP